MKEIESAAQSVELLKLFTDVWSENGPSPLGYSIHKPTPIFLMVCLMKKVDDWAQIDAWLLRVTVVPVLSSVLMMLFLLIRSRISASRFITSQTPNVLSLYKSKLQRTHVALRHDGRIVGFVTTATGKSGSTRIDHLVVRLESRREGVAKSLIREIFKGASKGGEVYVVCNESSTAARCFYGDQGFAIKDEGFTGGGLGWGEGTATLVKNVA